MLHDVNDPTCDDHALDEFAARTCRPADSKHAPQCLLLLGVKGKLLPYAAHYHIYICTSAHEASHAKAH